MRFRTRFGSPSRYGLAAGSRMTDGTARTRRTKILAWQHPRSCVNISPSATGYPYTSASVSSSSTWAASSRQLPRWPLCPQLPPPPAMLGYSKALSPAETIIQRGSIAEIALEIDTAVLVVVVVSCLLVRKRRRTAKVHSQEFDDSIENEVSRHKHSEVAESTVNMGLLPEH